MELIVENCQIYSFPVLKKTIKKIVLFESKPIQYALYIVETDRTVFLSEKDIDNIISISKMIDGNHHISEIMNCEGFEYKQNSRILSIMNNLHLFDENLSNTRFSEISLMSKIIATIKISISDSVAKSFYTIYWMLLIILVFVAGIILLLQGGNIIDKFTNNIQKFNGVSYLLSIVLTAPIFIIHEFAHVATACKYCLNKRIEINFALYLYLFPYLYVKIPAIYTIRREQRIFVFISGICANVLLGLFFTIICLLTNKSIFLSIAISNFQIAIINLIPFNLSDGYFILSNILKKCNLRNSYFKFLFNLGKKTNRILHKSEMCYIVVCFSYLLIFVFIELYSHLMLLLKDISIVYSILISIVLTLLFVLSYIVFIKQSFKNKFKK